MRSRSVVVSLLLVAALTACDGGSGEGTLEVGPRGPDDIVQHLVDPPAFPAPLTGGSELAELRNAEGTNRHQAYLAVFDGSGTLDGELVRGGIVRLEDGASLTVPDGASTATLDGTTVSTVGPCPAPCEVTGPALVAPTGWFPGIGVGQGWELVVPAPAE